MPGLLPSSRPPQSPLGNCHSRSLLIASCALVLALHLPCRGDSEKSGSQPRLSAGAASVDITPKPGVRLDGTISKPGPARGVHDHLYARALVLDDGHTRLAIVICDACMIGRDVVDHARRLISQRLTISPDHVLIAATHTHAAVRAIHVGTGPLDDDYHHDLALRIAEAVARADTNLSPAKLAFASFEYPQYLACRRTLCEPGSVGPNPFGETGERVASVAVPARKPIRPAGPVDPQFSILSVQHIDGRPLAVLGNFSVHYCGGYARGMVSADYFGCYSRALEEKLVAGDDHPPFVGMMSNGTSGNTGAIRSGGKRYPPFEWMKIAGRTLAEKTIRTIRPLQYRSDISLDALETELALSVRKPSSERIEWAHHVLRKKSENGRIRFPHPWTPVFAQETLHLSKYPDTVSLRLQAIRIGDAMIAAIPCEVFAETGLAIKQAFGRNPVFTIELANGYGGYLPPPEQHELGGYETWPARSSFLEKEAEPKIRQRITQLFNRLRTRSTQLPLSKPGDGTQPSPPHQDIKNHP